MRPIFVIYRVYFIVYPQDACVFEEKERRSKEIVKEAIQNLKDELRLLHGEDESIRTALAEKLAPVVKKTVQSISCGEDSTEEMVEKMIDIKKLSYRNPQVSKGSVKQYAAAVIRACEMTHCAE